MDKGAWRATVHRVAKSQTGLKQLSTHTGGVVFSRILSLYYGIISVYNGFFFSKLFLLIDSIRLWSSQRKVEEFIGPDLCFWPMFVLMLVWISSAVCTL